jgi:hypothetical protein
LSAPDFDFASAISSFVLRAATLGLTTSVLVVDPMRMICAKSFSASYGSFGYSV